MNRLLVALLAAFDAVVAVAVGIAAALAPLTLLWVFAFGAGADWAALWPTAVRVWQFGHLVPLQVTLPGDYVAAAGIPADAASFALSLAPLAFATFTALFAARSGVRAARAGAWPTGIAAGAVTVALLAVLVWITSATTVAAVPAAAAITVPALVFAVPALLGATVTAWREGDDGIVDAAVGRLSALPLWREVPAAVVRGTGVVFAGLAGIGALLIVVATVARGGESIALFQSAHVDLVGAITIALVQFAYLPTLVIWGAAYAAGPGFAIGTGTAISSAATNLGVVPGLPVLGLIPPSTSGWMLLSALLVVGLGVLAGAITRARMQPAGASLGSRALVLGGIVALSAAGSALLAVCASGSIGPGRMADTGPAAGSFALAVAVEVAVGAGIALRPSLPASGGVPRPLGPSAADAAMPSAAAAPDPSRTAADDTAGSAPRPGWWARFAAMRGLPAREPDGGTAQ
ncbi:DUF6350 family protein, partial [Microbacterium sp.]|uniref:cell division protein PerM n=1 Tax=Microbacterium sp. TaxID=51671 RepID=UPI003A88983D